MQSVPHVDLRPRVVALTTMTMTAGSTFTVLAIFLACAEDILIGDAMTMKSSTGRTSKNGRRLGFVERTDPAPFKTLTFRRLNVASCSL